MNKLVTSILVVAIAAIAVITIIQFVEREATIFNLKMQETKSLCDNYLNEYGFTEDTQAAKNYLECRGTD